jgi:hypothetical protein
LVALARPGVDLSTHEFVHDLLQLYDVESEIGNEGGYVTKE